MIVRCSKLSALPGIRHGWFTRQGGVSTGLYDSLNTGYGSDDDRGNIDENRGRIADALGVQIAFFFEGLSGDEPAAATGHGDILADKEALDLVRSYYAIPEAQRRRLFDLARVLSEAA